MTREQLEQWELEAANHADLQAKYKDHRILALIERVRELEAELDIQYGEIVIAISDLRSQNEILAEALEYYGVPDHYETGTGLAGDHGPGVLVDLGNKAREALAKVKR